MHRFGYLKSKNEDNPTGFITDDEEEENKDEEKKESSILKWMNDFNSKMMKLNLQINEKTDLKEKCIKIINRPSDIIRKKSTKDPTARGARPI